MDFDVDGGSCGISLEGEIICWLRPTLTEDLELPPGPFTQVVTGRQHICGLDATGDMRCIGGLAEDRPTPETLPGPFTAIEADYVTFCGLLDDGHPSCWWSDQDAVDYEWGLVPDMGFAQLGLGANGGCGTLMDGSVTCWGPAPAVNEVPKL